MYKQYVFSLLTAHNLAYIYWKYTVSMQYVVRAAGSLKDTAFIIHFRESLVM